MLASGSGFLKTPALHRLGSNNARDHAAPPAPDRPIHRPVRGPGLFLDHVERRAAPYVTRMLRRLAHQTEWTAYLEDGSDPSWWA